VKAIFIIMLINVGIVEDNKKISEGLAILIDGSDGFRCKTAYGTAEEALRKFPLENPDVVLMDINLPGISGIECIIRLKEILPHVQIMMLTVYEDDDLIFKSLVAGATGYILKRTPPTELLDAIKVIHGGGSPMSDQIARKVVQAFQQMGRSTKETENLSDRETEILSYLSKGFYDKEIADKLFISVKTVRTHLRNIYRKLEVRSRTEAVLKYLQKITLN
jgi:DNA-binding NarL/FixJ family response regulator